MSFDLEFLKSLICNILANLIYERGLKKIILEKVKKAKRHKKTIVHKKIEMYKKHKIRHYEKIIIEETILQ